MSLLTKEQLRGFIKENNLQTVPDIYNALKELFKETLQEMLEAELSTNLGYEKYEKKDKETTNSRNGYSQKTVKTQFGEMELNIPRDREGEF
ncbi:transposase, partial [Caloramator sp. CAR-1]